MAKFIFEMPDELALLVEAYRRTRGHKATAIAVRELISTGLEVAGDLGVFQAAPKAIGPDVLAVRLPATEEPPAGVEIAPMASLPLGAPRPAMGSRLKKPKG